MEHWAISQNPRGQWDALESFQPRKDLGSSMSGFSHHSLKANLPKPLNISITQINIPMLRKK